MSDEIVELKQRFERLQLLHQISNVIHSTVDSQQALVLILREAVQVMRAASGSLVLINPHSGFLEIQASVGLSEISASLKLRVGEGITGWVARTGRPALVANVRADPRYIMVRSDVRSELAVPLVVTGELRGVINVDSCSEDAFTAADLELLQALAVQAAKVIQTTWLYEQVQVKARLFETLSHVSRTINSTLNLDDALRVVTSEAAGLMNAKMCSLLMLDDTRAWLDLRASFGAGENYIRKARLSVDESFLGIVVRRKKPLQLDNVQVSSRYQNIEIAREEGLIALLSVPLLFGDTAIGALNVYKSEPYHFSNEEIRILSALAELSAIAIEKARLYERIVDVEEQLRQNEKLSALGLLAAEVAHEIRNPLTVMKMMFHSLDLQFAPDDPRSRDAEIMRQKMELLNKIVEQILDFARKSEPQFTPVNLNQLLEDLSLLTRHKLRYQGIELVQQLGVNLPLIPADATQLEQAFLNLTLNAIEAMPHGGKLIIHSGLVGNGKALLVEFKDSGEGMSEEQQERAFSSLLSTTKVKGTGLGLAIVGRVVEAHRGKIKIKSKPGRGTSISITFPV